MSLDHTRQLTGVPTPQEVADACKNILPEEDWVEIAIQWYGKEALTMAREALEDNGEDPLEFLPREWLL